MYVYIKSAPNLWTVGFYSPDGKFQPESDHDSKQEVAGRVAWLNGSSRFVVSELVDVLKNSRTSSDKDFADALLRLKDELGSMDDTQIAIWSTWLRTKANRIKDVVARV